MDFGVGGEREGQRLGLAAHDLGRNVYLAPADWPATIEREYLRAFIAVGGAAVKFAVVHPPVTAADVRGRLERLAREYDFVFAAAESATTRSR